MKPKDYVCSFSAAKVKAKAALLLLLGFTLLTASAHSQSTFVYTNNDTKPNTVSAFSVLSGGTLSAPTTYPTGGNGNGPGGGLIAVHRITTATTPNGNFLYAASSSSHSISVYSINAATGVLTPVGLPVDTGSGPADISLAVTPDGKFLYATGVNVIVTFSIASNGSLVFVPSPLPISGGTDGMTVSPDGRFLAVALLGLNSVAMFSIGSTGALTPVSGSPFPAGTGGGVTDVAINCTSNLLFAADTHPRVTVFTIASNGVLAQIPGSPFSIGGSNSNVGVLSPDDRLLFVSNQSGNTITSLSVAAGGSLTQAPGSPYPNPSGNQPGGMATNQAGTLLYAANATNVVSGFSIASNGVLSPVPGSPFATGVPLIGGELLSLIVFPAKTCACTEKEEDSEGDRDERGDDRHEKRKRPCKRTGEMDFEKEHRDH